MAGLFTSLVCKLRGLQFQADERTTTTILAWWIARVECGRRGKINTDKRESDSTTVTRAD